MSQAPSPPTHSDAEVQQPPTGKATASVILGVVALVGSVTFIVGLAAGIVGLILGVIAANAIGKADPPRKGRGVAITGIVLNMLGFIMSFFMLIVIMVAIMVPALGAARNAAMHAQEMSQLRQIGIAFHAYIEDNQGQYPEHAKDLYGTYLNNQDLFLSPHNNTGTFGDTLDDDDGLYRYGEYVFVSFDRPIREIGNPGSIVLAYSVMVDPDVHERNVLFLDGHVDSMSDSELGSLLVGYDITQFDDL